MASTPGGPQRWEVERTDEFTEWWGELDGDLQEAIAAKVGLLERHGPRLARPHADSVRSRHANMKELRVAHRGNAYRIFFAFDPRRVAILLSGGRKPDEKWYKHALPVAEKLYDEHLEALRQEGLPLE